jgi:hypothetical protein
VQREGDEAPVMVATVKS